MFSASNPGEARSKVARPLDWLAGCALLVACLSVAPAFGQALGDPADEGKYTALAPRLDLPLSPVRSAAEQLETFELPPGFRIESIAAEPIVHDPVAVAFDLQGNLWVAEMSGFNAELLSHLPDLAGGLKALPPGKIVKLESSRNDGRYDRRTVFLDGLRAPRALAILREGVLVADPPHLWLARDTDGDGRADQKTVVYDNYGRRGDDEGSANGLLWGRDNLIHNVSHPANFRHREGRWEEVPIAIRGQFGISQDDFGRLFFTRNSQQLRGDLFSPHYSQRHRYITDLPWANTEVAIDQTVWPIRSTPSVNRGYKLGEAGSKNGGLRRDGTLMEFTGACGSVIYRGANFPPSFYGNAFVPEPVGNLVKRTILVEAEGRLSAMNAYEGREFLTSTDERFRPVAAANAPDGSLVIVDMYRGIIEQYNFISSYLKEQTLRRRLHDAIQGKGRLWRVTYAAGPRDPTRPDLASADPGRLARLLDHPNGWWRDAAQQALVERGDRQAVPVLEQLAMSGEKEATRVAALWTLDGLGALNRAVAGRALHDRSGKVRAAAVRLHERWLAAEGAEKVVPTLAGLAADPDPAVAVQLALTLGEAKGAGAIDALYHVLDVAGAHPYIAKAIASGLSGREIDFIDFMIGRLDARGSPTFREVLTVLSSAITREGNRERVARLIERLGETNRTPAWGRLALLDGIAVVIHASRKPTRAQGQIVAALAPFGAGSDSEFGRKAGDLIHQIKAREKEALASRSVTRELTAAERQLAEYGRGAFAVCAGCHQPGGTGLPGVAPSLVASPWVAGRPEALIRILLQGKEGTPGFAGGMPPASSLTNMQIAGLLTYIRNSWGLQAGAIDASLVAQVRDKTAARLTPWTVAELEQVK